MKAHRILLAGLALALAAPGAAQAASWPQWKAEPTGIYRTARYASGEWIYTNGIQQAKGANTDGLHRTDYFKAVDPLGDDPTHIPRDLYAALSWDFFGAHRIAHNGDYQLPTDSKQWPVGTGDLAEVRLAVKGQELYVRFLWNAFPRPDAQIATLTFAGANAQSPLWPRNAKLRGPWDQAITIWGKGATLAHAQGGEVPLDVRTGDHVTETHLPLSALPKGPWTLRGAAGLDDPAKPGNYWDVPAGPASDSQPGSGGPTAPTNAWDLLFADDTPWTFDELHQSDDLAKADASADAVTVDPAKLRNKKLRTPAAPRTGDITRLFASGWSNGDGVKRYLGLDATGSPPPAGTPTQGLMETWQWSGSLQPYGMHVPDRYAGSKSKWPLIVYLHGFAGSYDEAYYEPAGLVAEADRQGYLVASPLERGDYFYKDQGDMDVMEVIRDVEHHYNVDPSRIYLMGHSMGGYGTNNIATHHPDLFAAVAPAEGTDSIDLASNLRNVPWHEVSAEEDLDTGAQDAKKMYGALSDAGYDASLLVYDFKIHEYSSIYDQLPALFRFFGGHRLVKDPAIVSWTYPAPQDKPDLGLVYNHAYWVSDVKAADAKANATVNATSDAIAHPDPSPATAQRTTQIVYDTDAPTKRSIGELYTTTPAAGPDLPRANALHLTTRNTSSLTIDLTRARLRTDGRAPMRLDYDSDQPLTLALRTSRGVVKMTLEAGKHQIPVGGRAKRR